MKVFELIRRLQLQPRDAIVIGGDFLTIQEGRLSWPLPGKAGSRSSYPDDCRTRERGDPRAVEEANPER